MAETLISPGVLARENDQSFIGARPVTFGAAIIGAAVKGPVNIPTAVSTFSQYEAIFGGAVESGSQYYTYLNSIAARNYFANGGESLLVTRVVTGSFTSAFTSGSAAGPNQSGIMANAWQDNAATQYQKQSFVLKTISEGELMNSFSPVTANGSLPSGSADNLRWEIATTNTSSGQFSLLIRRGNDINNQKAILETYNNLSMDPTAPNYIGKVIGDTYFTVESDGPDYYVKTNGNYPRRSAYVYVESVGTPTPQYFNNDGSVKPQFTGSLPLVGSGSFAAATGKNIENNDAKFNENITAANIQGIAPAGYTQTIALLNNNLVHHFLL